MSYGVTQLTIPRALVIITWSESWRPYGTALSLPTAYNIQAVYPNFLRISIATADRDAPWTCMYNKTVFYTSAK